jgi:RNA polymerase sigma-70 factor (ECF subfamily)
MELTHDLATRASLLVRLYRSGAADEGAWREFVDRYSRLIYGWCRYWHLQQADAEEVTQQVLVQMLSKMKSFDYDPSRSFRAWLKTVTHNVWRNMATRRNYVSVGGGSSGEWESLKTVAARDDLAHRLEQQFDRELLDEAMVRVRLRVAPHNWEAFRLTAVDGVAAPEVARRLQMKIANVYAARSNVQRLLREEVERRARREA